MNKTLEEKIKTGWNISYDPYSDLFQIYDEEVFRLPENHILTSRSNNIKMLFNKSFSQPVLIEIKNAYSEFGKDIENLDKEDIIKLVIPKFGEHYGTRKK